MISKALASLVAFFGVFTATQMNGTPDPLERQRVEPDYFRIQRELGQWQERYGASWRMVYDAETGHARFLFGGSAPSAFRPASDADYLSLGREALRRAEPLFGIESETLVEDKVTYLPLSLAGSTDKVTVQFRQSWGGVPVDGGFANVLFDLNGRVLSVDTTGLPGLRGMSTLPALDATRAFDVAMSLFNAETGLAATSAGTPQLVIDQIKSNGKLRAPRLAWKVQVEFHGRDMQPEGAIYSIDAITGAMLEREEAIHQFDVSGTVVSNTTPGTKPDTSGNPETTTPIAHLRVTNNQNGNVVYTDVNGFFDIPGATPGVQATFVYDGLFTTTNNQSGGDYSLTATLNSGSGNSVTMNPSPGELVTAQANSASWISQLRDWIRATNPTDSTADFNATSNVNIGNNCNAFYNGSSVNFYTAGGGCVNTAYSSVVVHEMGHWLNVLYGSGNGSDGFGEGNADVFAMYILDDNLVGEDFRGPGQHIRDGNNTRQFCGDCCGGCYGQVHRDGEVLMGALWKVRTRLKNTNGTTTGGLIADTLFNSWMNAYNDGQIKTIIEDHWLTLDDDDGNIGNGTPNYTDIDLGFRDQGFPGVNLDLVTIANVTDLPNTPDEQGPYTVDADITAIAAPPLTVTEVLYRVDGGPFQTLAMSPVGGDTFRADIPGQTSPATVDYYVLATDSNSNTATFPAGAPASTLSFVVGTETIFFADDFENGVNGWTHGQNQTQDDWMRSADVGLVISGGKAGDPVTPAVSGVNIWGNDLGPSGWNGFYANSVDNWLRSPVIDCSAAVGTKLRFWRWLTVEQGQYDQAEIKVNGTQVWVNPEFSDLIDTSWQQVEIDISALADGNPAVQIEWSMDSDAIVTFGGWNIDDVEVVTTGPSCTAPTGTPPADAVRCPGESATFTTTPSGDPPFTYQWKQNGTDIPGATGQSYTINSVDEPDEGLYSVVITDTCSSFETLPGTLTVNEPVSATDPADAAVCPGGNALFTTFASGTGPFTFQWKKDGTDIPGANSANYSVNNADASDAGGYSVEVGGACGTVETAAATLTVHEPVGATDPADATACPADDVTFSTTASGTGPFTYQWKKDGSDIPGATGASYTVSGADAGDAGAYSVEVTGACGSVETATASLTVNEAVGATDPADATACPADNVTFLTTASGTGPFTYQWKKDGSDIPGATGGFFTVVDVDAGDAGAYSVVVTGACGSIETAAATLTVNEAVGATDPSNATVCPADDATFSTTASGTGPFTYQWKKDGSDIPGATGASYTVSGADAGDAGAYSVVVTGACGSVETAAATLTVNEAVGATDPSNATVCPADDATFSTTASGTGPFTYQWKKDGSDIPGATGASYTVSGADAGDAGAYSVEVTGACGSVETAAATLTVNEAVGATDPSNATVCPADDATFSTTASGTGPFTYQWKKDGSDIPGATGASYTVSGADAGDAGAYSVEVTGACGSVETAAATLTVNEAVGATDPSNATVCPADDATFSTTASGTGPFTYQWKKDGSDIPGATGASYTVSGADAGDAGAYSVEVTGACGSVETAAATLTVNEAVGATDPSNATVCPADDATFSTTASGTGPFTYQWKKDGSDIPGATGASYTVSGADAGDAGAYSVEVTGACGSVETAAATLTVNEAVGATDPSNATVCPADDATFSTTASGTGPFTYQWKKDGSDIPGATGASYTVSGADAGDAGAYSVVVTGACGSIETAAATLTVNEAVGATDPSNATVCPADDATFSTTASGTGPFTYQWKKDGSDIPGATGASYTVSGADAGDAGAYSVVVTGACGSVETAAATLTVNEAVGATDPSNATVCPADDATFSTTASGTGPFTYQWKKDGSDIPGATGASYTVSGADAGDAGAYSVVVTGACGSVETAAATLTVNEAVGATDPSNATVCPADDATFSTTASGTGPFTYQWKKDGSDIPGATGASYTVSGADAGDAGAYSVVVTGACGSVETAAATLTVNEAVGATDPSNATVCPADDATFSTTASGTGPFTYQWKKDGSDIPGATGASYTVSGADAGDAGAYSVVVTGACGSVETAPATLTVNEPVGATDPVDETACVGSGVTFSTTASGTGPFTYQWSKDGADLPGETASSLTLDPVDGSDEGQYSVVVSGACGSIETASATLSVFGEVVIYCTAKPGLFCGPAAIGFSGVPSASATSGFDIFAGPARGIRGGFLLYSLSGRAALPFQGGTLCVNPTPLRRSVGRSSGGTNGQCDGEFRIDMNAFALGLLGGNPDPGLTQVGNQVNGQWWGRDTVANGSFLSDAIEYSVCP